MKTALENNWRQKSIENLEKQNFGNPDEAATNMVKRCLELCRVPLEKFTVEDLRLMIGQDFSLRYLIPLATEQLRKDIFIEGDLFPGDLLKNVLAVDTKFWTAHKKLWQDIYELINTRRDDIALKKISTVLFYKAALER